MLLSFSPSSCSLSQNHPNTHQGMDCELLTRAKEYRLKLLRRDSECDGTMDEFSSVEKMAHQYLQRNGGEEDYSDDEDDVMTDDFSVSVRHYFLSVYVRATVCECTVMNIMH